MANDSSVEVRKLIVSAGANIAKHRKKLGLTQRELSASAAIGYRYFQAIEGGKINMTLSTISKLSRALDVPASELLLLKDKEEAAVFSDS